jgi:2-phospho-L-lactate guanylyltransferase (CobY/MobA/RfbA family)
MQKTRIEVKPEPTVTKEMLSTSICKLSDAANELLNSGLNEKAILVLLSDYTKISKKTVKKVLDAMGQLRAEYTHG